MISSTHIAANTAVASGAPFCAYHVTGLLSLTLGLLLRPART